MATQRFSSGAIIKIRIDEDYHTYGRVLEPPFVAVFDCKTRIDLNNLNEIVLNSVLFIVAVRVQAITGGRWTKVGEIPLVRGDLSIPEQFIQDTNDREKCWIVDSNLTQRAATVDECEGMERMAVWEAEHVEERLRDHYAGRKNVDVEMTRVKRPDQEDPWRKVMPGQILKIRFEEDCHTYGRVVGLPNVAVYDCRTQEEMSDLRSVISKPVLFVVSVYNEAISKWAEVGHIPLARGEIAIPRQFYQDYFNPQKCAILHDRETRIATVDECKGLERASVWEPQDVEERIRDHYAGRTNRTLEYWKLRHPSKTEPPKPDSEKSGIDFGIRRKARMRPGKSLNDYGYDELKKFFIHMWQLVSQQLTSKVNDEADPIKSLERTEKESMASAKKAVIVGIQDIVYAAKDIDKGKRKEYDKYLKAKGALTFTEVRSTVLRQLSNILGRGKIQSEEEYYLLKEAITDVDDPQLSRRDREAVEQLLADFEDKIGRG